jgi:outer membrane protein
MNVRFKSAVTLLAAACAMAVASSASAQSAGQWTAKVGAGKITPKVESGDVSAPAMPNAKVAIGSDTEPVFIFAYGLTDNISAELDLGVPYKHKLYGAGSLAGTGQLATVEALPPSAFFQQATGSGGLTALLNTGGPASTFKIDGKAAATLQAGVAVNLNPRWFVDMTVTKTYLKVENKYSTGQTQQVKLDPVGVILAVGYKF